MQIDRTIENDAKATSPVPSAESEDEVRRNRFNISATMKQGESVPGSAHVASQVGGLPAWMATLSMLLLWALIALLSWAPRTFGEDTEAESADSVLDMSLEDLLSVEITSVSKRSEKRFAAPAAIYVLTQEDIRRSGAKTVPDVLRTVPGIHVAQITSNQWSVTSRGFSGRFANTLLVLIDGRSVYTPFFGGVYWEANDVMLEDVDRIEIIRGPGGTLWGANAVNGVINIVTKRASETQGGLVSVLGGKEERASGVLRYGGTVGDNGYYRAYGKYFLHDEAGDFIEAGTRTTGGEPNDDWQNGHGGFRMDFDLSDDETLTIQGGAQFMASDNTTELGFFDAPLFRRIENTTRFQGTYMLGRWNKTLSNDSEIQLQGYYDYYHFNEITLDEERHTADLDFQQRLQVGNRQDVLWGIGYRLTADNFENTAISVMSPSSRVNHLISGFVQDEITLHDSLKLTLGTKIEHNDYTGIEVQPSARLAWTPNDHHTVWAAVSRAVRTPSRSENDIRIEYGEALGFPDVFVSVFGNRDLDSSELWAFELGYRVNVTDRVALDLTAFYNLYDRVRTIELGDVFTQTDPPADIAPLFITSTGDAKTWGFEAGADFQVTSRWLLRGTYSFYDYDTTNVFVSTGVTAVPHHMVSAQNRLTLPRDVELDTTLRYQSDIDALGIGDYVELDARLAWKPREDLELALVGRNLLHSEHAEYDDAVSGVIPTEVQRTIYGVVTWRF